MSELRALGWVIFFGVLYLAAGQGEENTGPGWFVAKLLAFIGMLCAIVWWWPK